MKMPLLPVEAKQKKETETLSVILQLALKFFPCTDFFFFVQCHPLYFDALMKPRRGLLPPCCEPGQN